MRLFSLISAALFFLPACHYEDPHDTYIRERREWLLEEMSQAPFDCEGVQSAYYFRALLDGEEVCYSHGVDGYFADLDLWSSFTTETPHAVVSASGQGEGVKTFVSFGVYPPLVDAKPRFIFESPPSFDTTVLQHVEKYWLEGIPLLATDEDPEGINVELRVSFEKESGEGFTPFIVASQNGPQHDDRHFFEFRKVIREETREAVFYYLEAAFQCKLYHPPNRAGFWGEYFGELTEGELVMAIEIPR